MTVDPLRGALAVAAELDDADADVAAVLARAATLLGRVTERSRRGETVSTLLHAVVACAVARKRYGPADERLTRAAGRLSTAIAAAQSALAQDEACLGYQTWSRIAARTRTYGPRYGYIGAPSLLSLRTRKN